MYYRDAAAALVVFDITDKVTLRFKRDLAKPFLTTRDRNR